MQNFFDTLNTIFWCLNNENGGSSKIAVKTCFDIIGYINNNKSPKYIFTNTKLLKGTLNNPDSFFEQLKLLEQESGCAGGSCTL